MFEHVFFHTQACGNVGIAHPLGPQIVHQALRNKGDICSVSNPCQNTRSVSKWAERRAPRAAIVRDELVSKHDARLHP